MARLEQCIADGYVNQRSSCGKTPLMTAGYYCRKEALDLLLRSGAVPNALDEHTGDTTAHYIVLSTSGNVKQCGCMMVLSQYGVDIHIRNNDGYSVTALAEKMGNTDIAEAYDAVA